MRILSALCAIMLFINAQPASLGAARGSTRSKGVLRQLQPGDRWGFISRGIVGRGTRILPFSQTRTVEVLSETKKSPSGTECKVLSMRTLTRSPAGTDTSTSEAYFTQTQDGTILIHGRKPADKPDIQWVVDPPEKYIPDVKSPLSVGASWANTYKMSDDTTGTQKSEVVGTHRLKIPAGTFDSFVIKSQLEESDGLKVVLLAWYVPELGTEVLTVSIAKTAEGLTFIETEVLVGHSLQKTAQDSSKRR
jgi:hypothetical protein